MKAKISARALDRSGQQRVPISPFKSAKNDSAAALSKHDPVGPTLCLSPNRLISHPESFRGVRVEGVREGVQPARRDPLARSSRHQRGQRRRGELQRDLEKRDLVREKTLVVGT